MSNLLEIKNLDKSFKLSGSMHSLKRPILPAVIDVSLRLKKGETLGLVGESGCGKSTISKLIMGLLRPDSGQVLFQGVDLTRLNQRQLRPLRSKMQMIFQDPYASLNPRMTIADTIAEPFKIHSHLHNNLHNNESGTTIDERVNQLLERVGLEAWHGSRFPHEFSGGQRQRVGIARALALTPDLIIADEPVSALDLSIQAQIINLLKDLQQQFNLTYLFISHDLSVVEHLCNNIAVMYLGRIVEQAPINDFFRRPRHPYSETLLQALPIADPTCKQRMIPHGEVPSPLTPPSGCPFHPRCPYAQTLCQQQRPQLIAQNSEHQVACHRSHELILQGTPT
ncbi:MAG: oligopeptide/dipeptide ABC transporter ATP-binding protein [Thermodesulfobacteriota bacterium]|nr:oligopeptide/dipeptide ABC transporter ATP-binding protein [Thermodesulfobacteriota bacterium]